MLANLKFIGHLFLRNLLAVKVIGQVVLAPAPQLARLASGVGATCRMIAMILQEKSAMVPKVILEKSAMVPKVILEESAMVPKVILKISAIDTCRRADRHCRALCEGIGPPRRGLPP